MALPSGGAMGEIFFIHSHDLTFRCQVGASYKTLWTRAKHNAEARKKGMTKKRYEGLDQAPKFVSPTLTYQYGKDYSFKKGQQVSILKTHHERREDTH